MGIWEHAGTDLYIITTKLKDILTRLGYDTVGTIRQWADLNWLVLEQQGRMEDGEIVTIARNTVLRKISRNNVRVYGIRREAVHACLGINAIKSDTGAWGEIVPGREQG
jgi:hypothetical protein